MKELGILIGCVFVPGMCALLDVVHIRSRQMADHLRLIYKDFYCRRLLQRVMEAASHICSIGVKRASRNRKHIEFLTELPKCSSDVLVMVLETDRLIYELHDNLIALCALPLALFGLIDFNKRYASLRDFNKLFRMEAYRNKK